MKTIGLLGGMSWESSIEYERIINEEVRRRRGGVHSASLIIRSYDFHEIAALQRAEEWDRAARILAADAAVLERAGAGVILMCTNTMHLVADHVESAITVPLLHIGDVTAAAVAKSAISKVGLLGTRFTMERPFYRQRIETAGITVLVPAAEDRATVDRIIFSELVQGVITDESRSAYRSVIDRLQDAGAEGIIAGCTEIELLVTENDVGLPYFPTTRLHAVAAVEEALR